MIRTADWLFSGPGSPTYAMRWWSDTPVRQALHDRIGRRRGMTVFASAAAATLGRWVVPVYEVYKVGVPPHWQDGLDVLEHLDLRVAVIPHYDNTEGGTHDTRYCYLGERRLRAMESALPDDASILGIDEHTAVIIEPAVDAVRIVGRGTVTIRRHGVSTVLPAGCTLSLSELRSLSHGDTIDRPMPRPATAGPAEGAAASTVTEVAAQCERRFDQAQARRDADAMVRAILELEATVHAWRTDTEQDDGAEQARAILRTLIVRLGQSTKAGLADPADLLAPMVHPLLHLREQLRSRGDYPTADAVRDALSAAGVDLRDAPDGVRWSPRPTTTDRT